MAAHRLRAAVDQRAPPKACALPERAASGVGARQAGREPKANFIRDNGECPGLRVDWPQLPQHGVMPVQLAHLHQQRCLLPQPRPAAGIAASKTPLECWQASWLRQPERAGALERAWPKVWPRQEGSLKQNTDRKEMGPQPSVRTEQMLPGPPGCIMRLWAAVGLMPNSGRASQPWLMGTCNPSSGATAWQCGCLPAPMHQCCCLLMQSKHLPALWHPKPHHCSAGRGSWGGGHRGGESAGQLCPCSRGRPEHA